MSKQNLIGLLLIFGILIGSSLLFQPSKQEREALKRKQDSLQLVQQKVQLINDSIAKAKADSLAKITPKDSVPTSITPANEALTADQNKSRFGAFSNACIGKEQFVTIESELLKLKISNFGGRIAYAELKKYKTWDGKPLVLFNEKTSRFGFVFFSENRRIVTDSLFFQPILQGKKSDSIVVNGSDSVVLSMRLYPNASDSTFDTQRYIEFCYTLHGNDYMFGFDIKFKGMGNLLANNTYFLLDWATILTQKEKSLSNEVLATTAYYKPVADDVDYISERKDGEESIAGKVKWVAFKQQFFTMTLIAENAFNSGKVKTLTLKEQPAPYLKTTSATLEIPFNPSQDQSFDMSFYMGPTKFKTLRHYRQELERQIPIGWSFFLMAWINRYAVIPVFNFLEGFNINYGIIILILTILLKIVLFPIAYKTYLSSARMRVLKPEVEEINKKFPKKEDALKKQQATMELYKKAGVNPMSGCVPMLLQLPILIAMFRFFPASIELRQQAFLWANDLSSYDSILNLPFTIPFYGNHVSLFTLLMTISTIIYTKISNDMMSSSQQMPGMKTMMYLMPIMFLGFFNSYASALSYYYLLANLITFGQMWAFRRLVNEDKIHAQIQENKKKPVKKSGFQKRLEDMAKQRGYNPPKRK